jgi:heme exporter protein D
MSLEHFFSMGGYAFYVWTSYGIALAVLLLNLVLPWRREAEVRKDIARALRQEAARQERARP